MELLYILQRWVDEVFAKCAVENECGCGIGGNGNKEEGGGDWGGHTLIPFKK